MDWETFQRRGVQRRLDRLDRRYRRQKIVDTIFLTVGSFAFGIVIFLVVWGVTA